LCKARGMRQEVDSRDEVMHSEMSDWWFWAEQTSGCADKKKGKNHKQILTWTFVLLSFAPVLRNKSSRVRKFQGAKVPHLELSLPGANGLGSEKSSYRYECCILTPRSPNLVWTRSTGCMNKLPVLPDLRQDTGHLLSVMVSCRLLTFSTEF